MFSEELNKLIEAAFVDGVLTDKERSVILKRAKAEGADLDEVELLLDAEVQKRLSRDPLTTINTADNPIKELDTKISNINDNKKIAKVITSFPIPSLKEELLLFIPSMESKWLHTSSDADQEDIKAAYKTKYKESLSKAMMLYGSDPDFQPLFQKEKSIKKYFQLSRLSGTQSFLLFMLLLILVCGICMVFALTDWKTKDISTNGFETYQEAVKSRDFESAHIILNKMLDNYHNKEVTPYSDSWLSSNDRHYKEKAEKEEMLKAYKEGVDYVFNAEVLYLCSLGDKESLDRIVFLLSELEIEGSPIPEGEYKGIHLTSESKIKHSEYISSVSSFNSKCNKIIDLSIARHFYGLVERIIPLYKTIPDEIDPYSWGGKSMKYTDVDKEKAMEKVNNAIDSGVFPNVTEHIK